MKKKDNQRSHKYFLFELTKRCQNNCLFCYNVWKEDDHYPSEELSVDQAIKVLDNVFSATDCKYLGLTGGEPLLKDGFLEIGSAISARGVAPVLISNGKLLSKDKVKACIDAGVKLFEVSLHSHKRQIHDHLVGRQGSFEEALDAILHIKDAGAQVSTVFVACKENVDLFKDYVELAALLHVDWILFNRVACGGTCLSHWPSLSPHPDQLTKALEQGAPIAEKYNFGISIGVQVQPCLVDVSSFNNIRSNFCPLNDPTSEDTYFTIDPAGNLRMCNRSKTILGNLVHEPFDTVIQNKEMDTFCLAIPEFCQGCSYAQTCAGGCKADALSYFGTLSKPDPYLELYQEQITKLR